jgi:predicted ATPase
MKVRTIKIENYKSHKYKEILFQDFNILIGENGAGKTAILEVFDLIKFPGSEIGDIEEKVFGGINDNETKTVNFVLEIELSYDERKKYIHRFFLNNFERISHTSFLKKLKITFSIKVSGKKINESSKRFDRKITITDMEILGTNNKYIKILKEDTKNSDKVNASKLLEGNFLENISFSSNNDFDIHISKKLEEDPHIADIDKTMHLTNLFQTNFLNDFFSLLYYIPADRQVQKKASEGYVESLKDDKQGISLVSHMSLLWFNNEERFNQIADLCKRILPNIEKIRLQKYPDGHVTIKITKKNIKERITFTEESKGIENIFVLIWKIATSEDGAIVLLDEPELHLHPGAQKLLYDFIEKESNKGKQFFLATHSMVFIYKTPLKNILVILNREESIINNLSEMIKAADIKNEIGHNIDEDGSDNSIETRKIIYEALGYESEFAFEPDTIVVVEGKVDKNILLEFSYKTDFPIQERKSKIIPLGDSYNVKKYTPILAYTLTGKKCIITIDNDYKKPEEIKQQILRMEREFKNSIGDRTTTLRNDNFHLYPEYIYSVEYFLLNGKAICNAAEKI